MRKMSAAVKDFYPKEENNKITCNECGEVFQDMFSLTTHLHEKHAPFIPGF